MSQFVPSLCGFVLSAVLFHPRGWFHRQRRRIIGSDTTTDDDTGNITLTSRRNMSCYVYRGREGERAPKDCVRAIIHSSVRVIRARAFFECFQLKSVEFQQAKHPDKNNNRDNNSSNLIEIQNQAFAYCSSLESLQLPSSVRKLGQGLLEGNVKLKYLLLPANLQHLPPRLCCLCQRLEVVEWDSSSNTSKTAAAAAAQWQWIGELAFSFCTQLKRMGPVTRTTTTATAPVEDIVEIPNTVQHIRAGAFEFCTSIQTVSFAPTTTKEDCNGNGDDDDDSPFMATLEATTAHTGSQLISIGPRAFAGNQSLGSRLIIPSSVKHIHSLAFAHCMSVKTIVFETRQRRRTTMETTIPAIAVDTATTTTIAPPPHPATTMTSTPKLEKQAFQGCWAAQDIEVQVQANDDDDNNDKANILSQQTKEAWLPIVNLFRSNGALEQAGIARNTRITSLYKLLRQHGAAGPALLEKET